MKRLAFGLVLLTSIVLLVGCVTFKKEFRIHEPVDQISGIEIYYIDPSGDSIHDIDEAMEPVKVIGEELYGEITDDLEELVFEDMIPLFAPSDPTFRICGFIIRIEYLSGVYQLVCNSGTNYTYDASDIVESFHGTAEREVWNRLIIKYIGRKAYDSIVSAES